MGGNSATVIGWRFPEHIIEKLQTIQWWYWDHFKILENYRYFTEDVEGFCDRFYDESRNGYEEYIKNRNMVDEAYFMFVDYYENYSSYPNIIEEFLSRFGTESDKRLIMFWQTDCEADRAYEEARIRLEDLCRDINSATELKARLELPQGDKNKAKELFLQASHFIINRTFNTVYFTCLADRLGMDIISGVDQKLYFSNVYNTYK